ncbi:unnamed protein product [Linum trigynum]|uniref:Retrotransposon Copia-like N-terminal domain-containing protein n=1 Tax=Linum trigynum TaxID=586398 RepID=A0AAV2DFK8_9ROSI
MSSSTVSDSSAPVDESTIITFNPAAQLPLKLTPTNFNSWRSQLETLLMGLDLISFIDDTGVVPSLTITIDSATKPNPAYRQWFRQDKLILHALRCSISESLYSFVSAAVTSREAWLIHEKLYAGRSGSRIINLKGKLARMVKGDRDILTYVNDLKQIAAELALVGKPVSDLDLVVHCLRGLGSDYNHFSAAVRARRSTVSIEELLDSLIEYEADLKEQSRITTVPTAFYSHAPPRRNGGSFVSPGGGGSVSHGGGSSRYPHQRNPQGFANNFHPSQQAQANSSGGPSFSHEPNRQRRPSVVRQCFRLFPQACQAFHQARQGQANITQVGSSSSTGPWLMDTAASHHVTPDLGQLSLYSDYTGPDEILVGDGSGSSHGGAFAEGGKQR